MATKFDGQECGITYNEKTAFSKVQLKFVNLQGTIKRWQGRLKDAKKGIGEFEIQECRNRLKVRRAQLAYISGLYKYMLKAELAKVNNVA